jgi:hypothetical protein
MGLECDLRATCWVESEVPRGIQERGGRETSGVAVCRTLSEFAGGALHDLFLSFNIS